MTAATLHHGDALAVLRTLPDASIDAVVTDPPYGLAEHKPATILAAMTAWASGDRDHVPDGRGFMGRAWDGFVPPPAVWDECLRVLKPGGHLLCFAGTRTVDLMGLSVRLAGFEIRDTITWHYGSGFPKSLDVSKAIDARGARSAEAVTLLKSELRRVFEASKMTLSELNARCGFEASGYLRTSSTWATLFPSPDKWARMREVIGGDDQLGDRFHAAEREIIGERSRGSAGRMAQGDGGYAFGETFTDTAPATDAARQWQGWGTALKPASEPIIVARKPLAGTVAATVLAHGTGALNIDGCRVATTDDLNGGAYAAGREGRAMAPGGAARNVADCGEYVQPSGRWPANVVLSHAPGCGPDEAPGPCVDGCPVAELDAQSGNRPGAVSNGSKTAEGLAGSSTFKIHARAQKPGYADQGGASRFFPTFRYQAKAPTGERPKVDGVAHPTVKPLALMRWLVRLVTPPGGVVFDPFAGSGTTLQAARDEGFAAVGIEREPTYLPLIAHRLGEEVGALVVEHAESAEVAPAKVDEPAPVDPVLAAIHEAELTRAAFNALHREHRLAWTDAHTAAARARLDAAGVTRR